VSKRFDRKQGLLTRILSSINFLVTEDTGTEEMRNSARIECRAEVAYVAINGSQGKGYLVDISKTGLQLETEKKLAKGITIALNAPDDETLDRTSPFMAKVRWSRKGKAGTYRAGLELPPGTEEDPHWLESLLHQLGYTEDGSQRRRFIRADSAIEGRLTPQAKGSETIDVKVLNLGMGGAMLQTDSALPRNLQFTLVLGPHEDLPKLSLDGTILRIVEKSQSYLHPSRFATSDEREAEILKEYILKFGGRSGE
jgi:c-di-GMP-binding flagellar brake protein YcgR